MIDPLDMTADVSPEIHSTLSQMMGRPSPVQEVDFCNSAVPDYASNWPTIPGYQFLEKLESGALGETWRARQLSTGQGVAVKLIRNAEVGLLRELQRVLRLGSHPYLISILDARLSHDPPYIVTSSLSNTLSAWMKVHAHAAELNDRVSAWLQQAALGLSFVHRKGIFHCDIKPHNLLLDSQELLRLDNFGLAYCCGNLQQRGRPETYFLLPPEQILAYKKRDAGPSPSWDIYALGATFYYLLTSFYPRATPNGVRRLERCATDDERLREYWILAQSSRLVPIMDYFPGVDVRLAIIIERCLARDPAHRYLQATDLLADLELRDQVPTHSLDNALYSMRCWRHRFGL